MCMICVDVIKGKMTSMEARRAIAEESAVVGDKGDPANLVEHLQERYTLVQELEGKENLKANEPGYIRRTFK